MPKKYWLKRWVYAAECDGHLVILDARNDTYFLVDREEARQLKPALVSEEDPKAERSNDNGRSSSEPDIVRQMIVNDLITDCQKQGKPYELCRALPPLNGFEHTETNNDPPLHWHHIASVILLGVLVHVALRFAPLRAIIRFFSRRKPQPPSVADERKAIRLAAIYRRLRPFLYRSRLCLYDTFVFACFAKIYGLSPTLVFGVKGEPFEAHCWAQYGPLILNDAPQHTGQFTPIMIL